MKKLIGDTMAKKIYQIISDDDNTSLIAEEIAEEFSNNAQDDNTDYSFTISRESGKMSNNSANTFFVFDTKENTYLDKFKKALFDEDLKDIEENSEEEKELMTDIREYMVKIGKAITEEHGEKMKETVRRVILGNKVDKTVAPINDIEIISIDVADYTSIPESFKYLLRIGKKPDTECDTDEIIKFIQNREEETGMKIEDIFNLEKQAGNPLFDNIIGITKGRKYLSEISLCMFVDYSLTIEEKD